MKKEQPGVVEKSIERRVGLFVLITIIALVIILAIIGSEKKMFGKRFSLIVTFDHGGNVDKNTAITLAGIDVGAVKKIYINNDNKIDVVMSIQDEFREFIREDSVATIAFSLLTGSVIDISIGSKGVNALEDGDSIVAAVDTEIADKVGIQVLFPKNDPLSKLVNNLLPDLFDAIVLAFEKIDNLGEQLENPASGLSKLMANLDSFTKRLNSSRMVETGDEVLKNVSYLSGNLVERLPDMLKKFDNFLDELNMISKEMKNVASGFNENAIDLPGLIESLDSALYDLDEVMGAAKKSFLLKKHIKTVVDPVMIDEDVRDLLIEDDKK